MGIVSQSLQLGIQRRDSGLVALKATEGHKDHAFFKVRDLDAASIMLKLDLIPNTVDIMIGEGSMQICDCQLEPVGKETPKYVLAL